MNTLDHFEQVGSRGFYRPIATVSFERAIDIVADGIRRARTLGLADLMISTHGLRGFGPPSIFGRHELAVKWAEASGGSGLYLALVARAELIDPEKIGVLMAQNRGVSGDVFTSEAAALAWLDSRSGGVAAMPGSSSPP
jgi:hypothetical protein